MKSVSELAALKKAIEAEILHLHNGCPDKCQVESAEAEAVESLPMGWIRLQLVMPPSQSILRIYGDAEEILTALKKRNCQLNNPGGGKDFWQNLGLRVPPRLMDWPGPEVFWSSLPDTRNGCFRVYRLLQNSGYHYLAGYEGPNSTADEGWDYSHLARTPEAAAEEGFPAHWKENQRTSFEEFMKTVNAMKSDPVSPILFPLHETPEPVHGD